MFWILKSQMSTVNIEIINNEIINSYPLGFSPEWREILFFIQISNETIRIALIYWACIMCQLLSYSCMYFVNPHDYHMWELLLLSISSDFTNSLLSHSLTTYIPYFSPRLLWNSFLWRLLAYCMLPTLHRTCFITCSQTIEWVCGDQIKNGFADTGNLRISLMPFVAEWFQREREQLTLCTAVLARCIRKSRLQLLKAEAVAWNRHGWWLPFCLSG